MGQKVNPHGFRVGVIKDWDSRWYARADKVGDLIIEDYNIRKYLKELLYTAGVPKIEIERDNAKVRIFIHCAKPGVVIGKGGTVIEKLRQDVEKMISKPVALSIVEVKNADTNAQLISESIASQLERRIGFRRAMKNAMSRAMRLGVRGIKVMVSGRLGGAEIARSETYHEGTIPLQTLRADIEYGFAEAATTYGRIGVKVWVYNGEILSQTLRTTPRTMDTQRQPRDNRRNDNRRTGGNSNNRNQQNSGQGNFNNRNQQGGQQSGQQSGFNNRNQQGGQQAGGNNRNQQGGGQGASQGGNRSPQGGQPNTQQGGQNTRTQQPQSNNRPAQAAPAAPTAPAATPAPAAPTAPPAPTEGGTNNADA